MYYPTHRPQLTGIPTASVDCGVRATQMGLDWLSKGAVTRSVKAIRDVMGDQDATNYVQWDKVIDGLGGKTLGFSGQKTNDADLAKSHMSDGGAVIWAVHYGTLRKLMQAKCGSLTFNDYHAILTAGRRTRDGQGQWRDFDSLLDGRYQGCPNGPVWAPQWKLLKSAQEVGRREAGNKNAVFAVLLHRDPNVDPTEPGDMLPDAGFNLSDIVSDYIDATELVTEAKAKRQLVGLNSDLLRLIGLTGNPEADVSTLVKAGIVVK